MNTKKFFIYGMLLLASFLLFMLLFVPLSSYGQEPGLNFDDMPKPDVHHSCEGKACSDLCSYEQMLGFYEVLEAVRKVALKKLDATPCPCDKERIRQLIYSVDYMDDEKKKLNCCILKDFCKNEEEQITAIYLLTWHSNNYYCGPLNIWLEMTKGACRYIYPSKTKE